MRTISDDEYEEFMLLREFRRKHECLLVNINELGQLVDKLTAFLGNVDLTGVKKAPAKVKKLTRDERRARNRKNLRGIK